MPGCARHSLRYCTVRVQRPCTCSQAYRPTTDGVMSDERPVLTQWYALNCMLVKPLAEPVYMLTKEVWRAHPLQVKCPASCKEALNTTSNT